MEVLGLDPKITICKIAVLPVKLYPLFIVLKILFRITPNSLEVYPLLDKYPQRTIFYLRSIEAKMTLKLVLNTLYIFY